MGEERGPAVAAYAVAKTKDGGIYREVMSVADINKVRDVSRSKDRGPWVDWWSEMARKTVIRRLSKRLPMSTDLQAVIERDDDMYDLRSASTSLPAPGIAARLAAPSADAPREGFNTVQGIDPEDTIPDFEAETPADAASQQPATDTPTPRSEAGDTFPRDLPPAGEAESAELPEANANDEKSSAVDVIAWADKLIADLPFLKPEQVEHLEQDRRELAKFAILKVTDMDKARELERAFQAAKEG